MSAKSATIRDVARLAEVSLSTVSNVLNGRLDQMRPETTARVQRAMEALAYAPSGVARHLKTGHAPMIGLMVPSVANPFWGAFAQHIEEAAKARGYHVLLCNTERDPLVEQRYADALWSYGIRGMILGSAPLAFDHFHAVAARGMAIVAFDRQTLGADSAVADSVGVDNRLGARLAAEHLIARGHRRIGLVSGPLKTSNRLDRLDGYRGALRDAGITPDDALVWEGDSGKGFGDIEGVALGRRGARDLLSGPQPPTALIGINDMYALGAYAGVRDCGLRVPEDVSVVGFDDIVLAEISAPPLTTVRQPLREMMARAVDLLIGRVDGTRTGEPEHIVITPELVVRQSAGAIGSQRSAVGTGWSASD